MAQNNVCWMDFFRRFRFVNGHRFAFLHWIGTVSPRGAGPTLIKKDGPRLDGRTMALIFYIGLGTVLK